MLALYRCGRQAEALDVYRDARTLLVSELGLEPGPPLRELEAKILDHSPDLAPPGGRGPPRRGGPRRAPPGEREPEARSRRLPFRLVAVVCGTVLLGAVTLAALSERDGKGGAARLPVLDLAANSIAAIDARTGVARTALPLAGRPTDLAAGDGMVWAVTVDSATLTGVDARTGKIARQVPLRMQPSAVAAGDGAVWVVDGRKGMLVRVEPGYDRVSAPIPFRHRESGGRLDGTSVSAGAGRVWVTDGSASLAVVDPTTRTFTAVRTDRSLDGVAAGAGAVWAISSRTASVLRIDARTRAVTDEIPIARAGDEAPFPVGIVATAEAVWVLNQNTASVTRIDPRTRGLDATIPIGVDRVPNEIAAAGDTAWVANEDGTLSRISGGDATSRWVGESLRQVAVDGNRIWVATAALDQQMPGGAG
jgi:Bacterial transcriptional activator domain